MPHSTKKEWRKTLIPVKKIIGGTVVILSYVWDKKSFWERKAQPEMVFFLQLVLKSLCILRWRKVAFTSRFKGNQSWQNIFFFLSLFQSLSCISQLILHSKFGKWFIINWILLPHMWAWKEGCCLIVIKSNYKTISLKETCWILRGTKISFFSTSFHHTYHK